MGGVGQSTGWGGFVSCKNRFPGALACRGSDGEGWKCDFFLKLDSTRLLKTCWVLSLRYEEWSININRISAAIGIFEVVKVILLPCYSMSIPFVSFWGNLNTALRETPELGSKPRAPMKNLATWRMVPE